MGLLLRPPAQFASVPSPSQRSMTDASIHAVDEDSTHELRTEIRHLKSTIAALRANLEEGPAGREDAVQAVANAARDEPRQLHDTIQALRADLQEMLVAKE